MSSPQNADEHLSRITTLWTHVVQAHGDDPEAIRAAQTQIMQRYSRAVYRYLLKVVGDADGADEVFQEFALQFVRGGFRHASPERGRFRDYLKTSILNLVRRHRRRGANQAVGALGTTALVELPAEGDAPDQQMDVQFVESIREELLGRTWNSLKQFEHNSGRLYFTLLDYRAANPTATAEQAAAFLSNKVGPEKSYSAAAARKLLQRAREKFAEILLDELAAASDCSDLETLEEEAGELGLMPYCRAGLKRRFD